MMTVTTVSMMVTVMMVMTAPWIAELFIDLYCVRHYIILFSHIISFYR